jgi:uncharacterized protein with ParB-like and HNH nuclease domain
MMRWYPIIPPGGHGVLDAYSAQSRNIGDLLSDNLKGKIVVPQFQRGYSWGKKHVEDFWTDISEFQKESVVKGGRDAHFFGPIVIMQDENDSLVTYILDGQQRLATATILFSVLRDLAYDLQTSEGKSFGDDIQNHLISKEDYGLSLQMGVLDRDYFRDTIQTHPPTSKKPKIKSHRNISKAREILYAATKSTLPSDPVAALKLLSSLRIIVRRDFVMASIPVRSQRDAFKIFETLNDRGLRLSVPDLLLNFLMGLAADDPERDQIRKYWDGMIEGMGKKDVGQFLRHIWVSKYGDLKNVDLYTALKKHIEDKKVKSIDFAQTCSEECEKYIELLRANKDDLGESAAKNVNALINDLGFDQTLPLLLSAHMLLDKGELDKVARLVLVFVTRYSMLLGLDISGLENTMYALAKEIRDLPKTKVISHIKETLVKRAPDDKQLLAMKVDGEQMELMQQDAVYIMSRLANKMQSKTKEITLNESNLEHVFPKNPSSDWTNKDELEEYLWHLGNLTMLGKRINGAIGNAGYTTKRAYYEKNTELKMTQELAKQYSTWNVASIHKRASQLLPKILEVWNFNNTSFV